MANVKYYKRTFLNKKKGTATIEAEVENDWASVTIRDCNRTVNLDFSPSHIQSREDNLYKINKLIEELTAFRGKLIQKVEA